MIDASVLTDVLLEREQAVAAVDEQLVNSEHEAVHAPEVIEPETVNALRKMSFRGQVTVRRATQAVSDIAKIRLIRYPHGPLRARMWELRDELSAYDAAYLALAEALGDAVLLTADGPLATVARRHMGRDAVRLAA